MSVLQFQLFCIQISLTYQQLNYIVIYKTSEKVDWLFLAINRKGWHYLYAVKVHIHSMQPLHASSIHFLQQHKRMCDSAIPRPLMPRVFLDIKKG